MNDFGLKEVHFGQILNSEERCWEHGCVKQNEQHLATVNVTSGWSALFLSLLPKHRTFKFLIDFLKSYRTGQVDILFPVVCSTNNRDGVCKKLLTMKCLFLKMTFWGQGLHLNFRYSVCCCFSYMEQEQPNYFISWCQVLIFVYFYLLIFGRSLIKFSIWIQFAFTKTLHFIGINSNCNSLVCHIWPKYF